MSRRILALEALETRQLMAVDAFYAATSLGSGQANPAAGNVDYFLKIDPNNPNQPNPAAGNVDYFLKHTGGVNIPGPHVRPGINTAHTGGANWDPSNPNGDPAGAHVDYFSPQPGDDQGAAINLGGATPKNSLIGLL